MTPDPADGDRKRKTGETLPKANQEPTAQSLFALASYYQNNGHADEAVEIYLKAIEISPGLVEAYYNIGVIRYGQNDWAAAISHFKKALELSPNFKDAAFNLAASLKEAGQFNQAAHMYEKVVQIDPMLTDAFFYKGSCHLKVGQAAKAITSFQHASQLEPDNPIIWFYLAEAHVLIQSTTKAIECYQKAIALKQDWDSAHYNLAVVLRMEQRLDEAIDHLKLALQFNPDFSAAHAFLFRLAQHVCDWPLISSSDECLDRLTEAELAAGMKCGESPITCIRRKADVHLNLKVAASWSQQVALQAAATTHPPFKFISNNSGRIRIGYLSNDFKDHAVAYQVCGMLSKHNRQKFEIFGYATNPDDGTPYRQRLAEGCDHFRDIHAVSNLAAAQQIHADGIDILVDMAGHSRNNRMGISALRPAPVQVSYLGFLGTTGAGFIDYVLADAVVVPKNQASGYSENIIYLPNCYQVNDDQLPISKINFKRRDFNLPDEGFVFCCFNQPYKIEARLFNAWLNILKQVEGSVLWLVKRSPQAQANLCLAAQEAGIDPKRLVFTGFMPLDQNLARLQLADLVLDTLTYNGGATTSNALWAGVPVLTVMGEHWVSRMSASALTAIGLPELITEDLTSYMHKAVRLANRRDQLGALRQKLSVNRNTTPLFNTDLFTRHIEHAFTTMFRRYKDNLKPAAFKVTSK